VMNRGELGKKPWDERQGFLDFGYKIAQAVEIPAYSQRGRTLVEREGMKFGLPGCELVRQSSTAHHRQQ